MRWARPVVELPGDKDQAREVRSAARWRTAATSSLRPNEEVRRRLDAAKRSRHARRPTTPRIDESTKAVLKP
jgi:hypothetical protein